MATEIYSRLYPSLASLYLSPSFFLKIKKKEKEEKKRNDEEKFKPAFRGERLLRI